MARCLSELLVKYQNAEEAKILSIADELDEAGKELVRNLYEPLKITSEDLSREYSPSETKQLCLRTKVRVNMTLFNCVWEAKQRLDKKGRLANRSERFVNAMLVKAVAKKMVLPYTSDEIAKCNHIRQCQLKKANNCRLNLWRWQTTQSSVLERSNLSPSLLAAQIPEQQPSAAVALKYPVDSQSSVSTLGMFTEDPEMWIIEETPETDDELVENLQVVGSQPEHAADMDWADAAAQINTESITIETLDLDLQTQPSESQPILQSSEDYIVFNTQVPATSTQSQCTEPFL